MAFPLRWTTDALKDLEEIRKHLGETAPARAGAAVSAIVTAATNACTFPLGRRKLPEVPDATVREVFCLSYRIIYEVLQTEVVVLCVIHQRRQIDFGRLADQLNER